MAKFIVILNQATVTSLLHLVNLKYSTQPGPGFGKSPISDSYPKGRLTLSIRQVVDEGQAAIGPLKSSKITNNMARKVIFGH
jgi:hypothetical protein